MVSQEIITREKEYLVNVLHKQLTNSEERNDKPGGFGEERGYVVLAKKYWPECFTDGQRKHVHHINFDRSDNRACNLVVLTPKEHRQIHKLFDPDYGVQMQLLSELRKGSPHPWMVGNRFAAGKRTEEQCDNIRRAIRNKHRVYHPDGTWHMEMNEEGLI